MTLRNCSVTTFTIENVNDGVNCKRFSTKFSERLSAPYQF